MDSLDASTVGCNSKTLLLELTKCLAECQPCVSRSQQANATNILFSLTLLTGKAADRRAVGQWLQAELTEITLCHALCLNESPVVRGAVVKLLRQRAQVHPAVVDAIVRRQLRRTPPTLTTCTEFVDFLQERMLGADEVPNRLAWVWDLVGQIVAWRSPSGGGGSGGGGGDAASGGAGAGVGAGAGSGAGALSVTTTTSPGHDTPSQASSLDVNPGHATSSTQPRPVLVGVLRMLQRAVVMLRSIPGALLHPLSPEVLDALPPVTLFTYVDPLSAREEGRGPALPGVGLRAAQDAPVCVVRYLTGFLLQQCLFAVPGVGAGPGAVCRGNEERSAGFSALRSCLEQLQELGEDGPGDVRAACHALIREAFGHLVELSKGTPAPLPAGYEWNYSTSEEGKGDAGFVGLKNLGSTCYINSAVQQLFMSPAFRRGILAANPALPRDLVKQVRVWVWVWAWVWVCTCACCVCACACVFCSQCVFAGGGDDDGLGENTCEKRRPGCCCVPWLDGCYCVRLRYWLRLCPLWRTSPAAQPLVSQAPLSAPRKRRPVPAPCFCCSCSWCSCGCGRERCARMTPPRS